MRDVEEEKKRRQLELDQEYLRTIGRMFPPNKVHAAALTMLQNNPRRLEKMCRVIAVLLIGLLTAGLFNVVPEATVGPIVIVTCVFVVSIVFPNRTYIARERAVLAKRWVE